MSKGDRMTKDHPQTDRQPLAQDATKARVQVEREGPPGEYEVDDEEDQPSDAETAVAIDEAETEDHLDERDELSDEVEEN